MLTLSNYYYLWKINLEQHDSTKATLSDSRFKIIEAFVLFTLIFVGLEGIMATQRNRGENILFIGNSYTYENDGVDQHLSALLNSTNSNATYRFVTRAAEGKYHLCTHWHDAETQTLFNSRRWDKIILQEYNSGPLKEIEEFNEYAERWENLIKSTNNNTKIYLLSTWKYRSATGMEDHLFSAYTDLSKKINAGVIPVGHLWKSLESKVDLYDEDGAHPNRKGTFLTACLFYEQMFGKNVTLTNNTDETISDRMQTKLKKWAHEFNHSANNHLAQNLIRSSS